MRDAAASFDRTSESDHRIANHLAMLASYVRMKGAALARGTPDPVDVALLIQAIEAQINAISALHRLLSTEGTLATADLAAQLNRICSALRWSGVTGETRIEEALAPGCDLPLAQVLPVAQIVTEVVTNALKYGRPADAPARLRVCCRRDTLGAIQIEVRDNGPGLIGTPRGGLGFRLIAALVTQIGATLDYRSTPQGLTVRLTLAGANEVAGHILNGTASHRAALG